MTSYAQGFMDKCAEYGVDPEAMSKLAMAEVPESILNEAFIKYLRRSGRHRNANAGTEAGGSFLSALLPPALGAGLGALFSKNDRSGGALLGAAAGAGVSGVSSLASDLMAAIIRKRTEAEQIAHDNEDHSLKNLLIPGYGLYHAWKRNAVRDRLMDTAVEEKLRS